MQQKVITGKSYRVYLSFEIQEVHTVTVAIETRSVVPFTKQRVSGYSSLNRSS